MHFRNFVVAFLALCLLELSVLGSQKVDTPIPCTWEDTAAGETYDLSPLMAANDYYIPKGTFPNQGWDIWINVCRALVSQTCGTTAAGCQQWDPKSAGGKASMGAASTIAWQPAAAPGFQNFGVTIQFTQGDMDRKMEIDFKCDPNAGIGSPAFSNELPTHHYNFQWVTEFGCPAKGGGLSPGSIMLIIILCLIVVYVVAGILFNKFKRGLNGIEMIPNVEFWISIPGLVKDGVMFLVGKITRRGQYSQM
jgi:hypothetical protein